MKKPQTVIERYNKWLKDNKIKKGQFTQVFTTESVFIVSKLGTVIYGQEEVTNK